MALINGGDSSEKLTGTEGDDTINGLAGADTLEGLGGADLLDGGVGADLMKGGPGDDVYVVDDYGDVVSELANEGADTVRSNLLWYVLNNHVERLTLIGSVAREGYGNTLNNTIMGGAFNDTLGGLAGDDSLDGGAGDDYLNGGTGADTMVGGTGNDTFVIDSDTDVVVELAGGGVDTVLSHHPWAVTPNSVENLTLIGVGDQEGYGNSLNNTIVGNAFDNTMGGLDGDDRLEGKEGDDFLNGGNGNDTLIGGVGNDIYVVESEFDLIIEAANEGTDTVWSHHTWATIGTNIENLKLIGGGFQEGYGNSGANTITGSDFSNFLGGLDGNDSLAGMGGNDTLNGGSGSDTMVGGTGDDLYVVESSGDVVTELSGEGTDTVWSHLYETTLWSNVENLVLIGGGAQNAAGNSLANSITGNAFDNLIDGGSGNDTLDGGAGSDWLIGGPGSDVGYGGDGDDRLDQIEDAWGGAGHDIMTADRGTLRGEAGNDTITAFDGATVLGGADNDSIYMRTDQRTGTIDAGDGDDFVFVGRVLSPTQASTPAVVVTLGAGADVIEPGWDAAGLATSVTDFTVNTDKIDLTSILASLSGWNNATNPFGSFLRLQTSGSDTLLQVDQNGGADGFVTVLRLVGVAAGALDASEFVQGYAPTVGSPDGPHTSATPDDWWM